MTAKHIYNIVLEIRGKQISHELIQTGEKGAKSEKKPNKTKAADLEYILCFSAY